MRLNVDGIKIPTPGLIWARFCYTFLLRRYNNSETGSKCWPTREDQHRPDEERQQERDELRQNFLYVCKQPVLEVGVKRAVCVQAEEDLQEVARILGQKKFKKVPVISGQQLVGIISRGDVIRTAVKRFLNH